MGEGCEEEEEEWGVVDGGRPGQAAEESEW